MTIHKISNGTMVSVKPGTSVRRNGRRRYSEGGLAFVMKRKKRGSSEGDVEEEGGVTSSPIFIVTTTTNGTGATIFDVCYNLDQRLSQEVGKDWVSIAMVDTTARRRRGNTTIQPSLMLIKCLPDDQVRIHSLRNAKQGANANNNSQRRKTQ